MIGVILWHDSVFEILAVIYGKITGACLFYFYQRQQVFNFFLPQYLRGMILSHQSTG